MKEAFDFIKQLNLTSHQWFKRISDGIRRANERTIHASRPFAHL